MGDPTRVVDDEIRLAKSKTDYLQHLCHDLSREGGWWHGVDATDVHVIATKLMLIVSEISEAMEGVRKDLFDDKIRHRKMVEVELADALIRIFDLAGKMNLDLGGAMVDKLFYNRTRADHKPEARAAAHGKKF